MRDARRLRSCDIHGVAEAVHAFGEDSGLLCCRIQPPRTRRGAALSKITPFITIPEGFYGLVLLGGADVNFADGNGSAVWPAGFHWGAPWLQVGHLVTKQSVVYHCDVKRCVTSDDVPVVVRVSLVLRIRGDPEKNEDPAFVRKFVYELGARGLEAQLNNAVAEDVRVMVRSTTHQAVHFLTSANYGQRMKDAARHPSPPLASTRSSTHRANPKVHHQNLGDPNAADGPSTRAAKRNQVVPHPDVISHTRRVGNLAEASSASTLATASGEVVPVAAMGSTSDAHCVPGELPTIRRGLRASRVFPADIRAATDRLCASDIRGTLPTAATFERADDHKKIYPENHDIFLQPTLSAREKHNLVVDSCYFRTRPPPAAIDVDLSPSRSLSESSSLPKLQLDIPRLDPVPSIVSLPKCEDDQLAQSRSGKKEEVLPAATTRAGAILGSGQGSSHRYEAEGDTGKSTSMGNCNLSFQPGRHNVCAEARGKSRWEDTAETSPSQASLARRHAEQLRDRLNKALMPQGVEITSAMIRSVELPRDIAERMAERTLSVSRAQELRAVKLAGAQKVKHEGEVKHLRQRFEIERALVAREGQRRLEEAYIRLTALRARAEATVCSIAADSAVRGQRLACEARLHVSRSLLRESAASDSKAVFSETAAWMLEAEADVSRIRIESEAKLKVERNTSRAREYIDEAEGKSARMLSAARAHTVAHKRIEVWRSLAENRLALVTASPLLAPASPSRSPHDEAVATGLAAFLLGEAVFKEQILQAAPSSEPSGFSVARRGLEELGAQMALARPGPVKGGSPFAVVLNLSKSPFASCEGARRPTVGDKCFAGNSRGPHTCFDVDFEDKRFLEQGTHVDGGSCVPQGPRRRERRAEGAGVFSSAECELCILRNGVPHRLLCYV